MAERSLAYVSNGALFFKVGAKAEARALEIGPGDAKVAGLARGRSPGEVLYARTTDDASGVFAFDPASNVEARLFQSADHRVQYPHIRAGAPLVACSVADADGASIAVMHADGSSITIVTEGDSLDAAPRWVPRADRSIVYQSAGIGRDAAGKRRGVGPSSIQRIDLRKGELETLAEDPACDLLGPQIADDGALYFIRRPYEAMATSPWRAFVDWIAAPFRAKRAPSLVLWGSAIEAQAIASDLDTPSVVPASWQLCRQRAPGEVDVLARGVVSFDLDGAGGVVFTNGRGIYALGADGVPSRVGVGERVEQVAVIA